uniref:Pecanex_C domain-containing protein n=1 Tax=Macrostomum lignano TaxID=282301 RepID=A0A1I8F5P1_9PLAT
SVNGGRQEGIDEGARPAGELVCSDCNRRSGASLSCPEPSLTSNEHCPSSPARFYDLARVHPGRCIDEKSGSGWCRTVRRLCSRLRMTNSRPQLPPPTHTNEPNLNRLLTPRPAMTLRPPPQQPLPPPLRPPPLPFVSVDDDLFACSHCPDIMAAAAGRDSAAHCSRASGRAQSGLRLLHTSGGAASCDPEPVLAHCRSAHPGRVPQFVASELHRALCRLVPSPDDAGEADNDNEEDGEYREGGDDDDDNDDDDEDGGGAAAAVLGESNKSKKGLEDGAGGAGDSNPPGAAWIRTVTERVWPCVEARCACQSTPDAACPVQLRQIVLQRDFFSICVTNFLQIFEASIVAKFPVILHGALGPAARCQRSGAYLLISLCSRTLAVIGGLRLIRRFGHHRAVALLSLGVQSGRPARCSTSQEFWPLSRHNVRQFLLCRLLQLDSAAFSLFDLPLKS